MGEKGTCSRDTFQGVQALMAQDMDAGWRGGETRGVNTSIKYHSPTYPAPPNPQDTQQLSLILTPHTSLSRQGTDGRPLLAGAS